MKNEKIKSKSKGKKVEKWKEHTFSLKRFKIEKGDDVQKLSLMDIFDNQIIGKSYQGELSTKLTFVDGELGLGQSNVSDEILLALVPELHKLEGSFFGQKTIIDNEERYPVFFSTYRKEHFARGGKKNIHVTGFAYLSREAVSENRMIGIIKE